MLSAEDRSGLARQVVTVIGGIAQVVLPVLLLPGFRRRPAPPDVVQPAPWTFTVWLPVYVASLVHVVDQRVRRDPLTAAAAGVAAVPLLAALVRNPPRTGRGS